MGTDRTKTETGGLEMFRVEIHFSDSEIEKLTPNFDKMSELTAFMKEMERQYPDCKPVSIRITKCEK